MGTHVPTRWRDGQALDALTRSLWRCGGPEAQEPAEDACAGPDIRDQTLLHSSIEFSRLTPQSIGDLLLGDVGANQAAYCERDGDCDRAQSELS